MLERAILIEDEINVRKGLRVMIQEYCPDIEIVGEAGTVKDGFELIVALKPDIVFLDIRLPDGTGFDLLSKIASPQIKIIFVTAYSDYSLKAIKYSAIDYILKPVIADELIEAVKKATKFIQQEKEFIQLTSLNNQQALQKQNKIVIKTKTEAFYVQIDDIIYCKADGNYSTFYFKDLKHVMVAKTLKFYEEILSEYSFIRVHQTYLVNTNFIVGYLNDHVKLTNGDLIEVSRRKKSFILSLLERKTNNH